MASLSVRFFRSFIFKILLRPHKDYTSSEWRSSRRECKSLERLGLTLTSLLLRYLNTRLSLSSPPCLLLLMRSLLWENDNWWLWRDWVFQTRSKRAQWSGMLTVTILDGSPPMGCSIQVHLFELNVIVGISSLIPTTTKVLSSLWVPQCSNNASVVNFSVNKHSGRILLMLCKAIYSMES